MRLMLIALLLAGVVGCRPTESSFEASREFVEQGPGKYESSAPGTCRARTVPVRRKLRAESDGFCRGNRLRQGDGRAEHRLQLHRTGIDQPDLIALGTRDANGQAIW